jgi:hypothetical protein
MMMHHCWPQAKPINTYTPGRSTRSAFSKNTKKYSSILKI